MLGPLQVTIGQAAVMPSAAKPRKVLAMLALHANEMVPVPALFEELWGDAVPRKASTTLQTYILQLRNLIAPALSRDPATAGLDAKDVIATQPGGYLLHVPQPAVDAGEFERLAAVGHRAHERGDFPRAAQLFRDALAYWRGTALADIQLGALLAVECRRLEETRINTLDRRIDADLRMGRHHEIIGELTALVARNRTNEGLSAHLMVALHRCGRRGDAIGVYRGLRASLVADLGLEPSPLLHRLHRHILTADAPLAYDVPPVRELQRAS
ncbi:hypothetical protein GCM10010166_52890 [Couchioplanes caeruleus subsp. azureus]|nr:hypothetical protein GCM10010166_52890 [Couchioplanes caeruleus subsp. azureus]